MLVSGMPHIGICIHWKMITGSSQCTSPEHLSHASNHVSVWQKPLQYCKVISLQLIKTNGEKMITVSLVTICSHTKLLQLLFTIFLILYMTSSWLIYSITGGLYILILFTCFVPPASLVYSLYLCLL